MCSKHKSGWLATAELYDRHQKIDSCKNDVDGMRLLLFENASNTIAEQLPPLEYPPTDSDIQDDQRMGG